MAKRQKHATEEMVVELAKEWKAEVKSVEGDDSRGHWPLFKGFRVVKELTDMVKEGRADFEAGNMNLAYEKISGALESLRWRARAHFRNSPEKYFNKEIEKAHLAGVPNDLIARAEKWVEKIREHARSNSNFDLAAASDMYWDAQECLQDIYRERDARLRNAEAKQNRAEIDAILARANERAKQARQEQAEYDKREAARRSILAKEVFGESVAV